MTDGATSFLNGHVLYVDERQLWSALGNRLMTSTDGGNTWSLQATIPANFLYSFLGMSRVCRRFARVGWHHFLPTESASGTAFANKAVLRVLPGNPNAVRRVAGIRGSRPLRVCLDGQQVYYGEYRANPERSPVHVWSISSAAADNSNPFKAVWSFDDVRHVHGCFYDPYSDAIWVTTGDEDSESAIWITRDRFQTLERVIGGSQQYRAVELLFTAQHVYFGSDAPTQQNHLYRMDRYNCRVERLATVGGPVFYGAKVGDALFFSTVVEPGTTSAKHHAEVWGSPDGAEWRLVHHFRKDRLPMKYFQYGQVKFPAGPGDGKNLWMTPFATEFDQQSLCLPVESVFQ